MGHPQSVSQSDASYNFYYIDVVTPDAYNSFMADPHFMDLFEAGDIRLDLFQWMREGYLGYRKFRIRADQTGDIVVMRSAEMYLIAAEALAREGQLGEAVKPLNTLRNARGLADYDLTGKRRSSSSVISCWNAAANCGAKDLALPTYCAPSVPLRVKP